MTQVADPSHAPSALRSRRAVTRFLVALLILLAADLSLKAWAFANVGEEGLPLVPYILELKLTYNHGAVFGLWQGQRTVFVIASIFATGLIALFFQQSRENERAFHFALAAILAGAIGNLYDRIVHQAVRDMLYLFPDVHLPFNWRWPQGNPELYPWIFNLADVFLLAGIALILIRSFFPGDKPAKSQPAG